MHDPEFEKKVQQKMEELQFSPSEIVWTNLEKQINTKKKRRIPLFWLFFLPGLLVGAAGAYMVFSPATKLSDLSTITTVPSAAAPSAATSSAPPVRPAVPSTSDASISVAPRTAAATPLTPAPATATPLTPAARGTATAAGHRTGSATTPDQVSSIPAGPARNNSPIHTDRSARTGNPAPESHPALSNGLLTPAPSSASQTTSADQTASAEPPGQENESSLHRSATGNIAKTGAGLSGNTLGKARPVYPKWITDHLAALHPAAKAPYRASVWQAGFAGGGGLSTIHQHLSQPALNSLSSTPSGTSYNFLSARDQARAAAAAAAAQKYASRIQPDFSFWAGIFAQRPVGKKLSLSVGLNLHYYSTIVETGKQITAPYASPVTSSLFYSTAVVPSPSTVSYPYYPAGTGSRFTNQYYFLELPVSVQWQLNSGRKMPIFWEGGLSVSRLMSASALSYDGSAGVYYKTNGGSAQTTQVSASTAFMIGLSRGATRIQFGPQLQYGLTSLSNGSTGGGQHLLYGGLKFTLIPGQRRGTLAAR